VLGRSAVIFASVGSMLPFDRLIRGIDEWARDNPSVPVFIQIGEGDYEPRYAPFVRIMPMTEYRERLRACDLFVAHVGMGSIMQALEERKQLLMMPRRHDLGEHTTDHQLHTAERFKDRNGLMIVDDVLELQKQMTRLLAEPLATGEALSDRASPELIAGVTRFLDSARPRH
jgi:UDP-N-acetylglucosamine transferase subunit ALG13